jgi:hypothetical protein
MGAKITLYSQTHLIDEVKKYAKKHNTSVSKIVTDFFELIVRQENEKNDTDTKNTSKLFGLLKDKQTDKTQYYEHLEKKYL